MMSLEIIVAIIVLVLAMVLGYFMGYIDAKNSLLKTIRECYEIRGKRES